MRCITCNNEFVASRSDARFCSAVCRVKASRQRDSFDGVGIAEMEIAKEEQKKEEQEIDQKTMTPDGQVRGIWDKEKPIKNLEGGYLHIGQTQEEYIENIPEVGFLWGGKKCPHKITYQSRCMECMAYVKIVRADKEPLLKGK